MLSLLTRINFYTISVFSTSILLLVWFALPVHVTAIVSNASDQLERLNETTASGHTIKFVTSTGIAAGQTIVLNFPASTFTFGGAYDHTDMALAEGNSSNCTTATFTSKTLGASPSGTTWGATYASNTITFTSGTDTITANRCVRIILSTNGGTHALTNPTVGSNTSYVISIVEAGGDIGSLAVLIVDDAGTPDGDQVELQATLTTVLSLDVDVATTNCQNSTETNFASNIIAFGTLAPAIAKYSDSTIRFACLDVATNAASGINVFIRSARASTSGGLVRTGGSAAIVSATANLNLGGVTEGYGARIASTGTPTTGTFTAASPFNSGTAGSVGLVPGTSASPALLVSSTGPAQTGAANRIAVEVGAKASVGTAAGSYTDILTFTATASF